MMESWISCLFVHAGVAYNPLDIHVREVVVVASGKLCCSCSFCSSSSQVKDNRRVNDELFGNRLGKTILRMQNAHG